MDEAGPLDLQQLLQTTDSPAREAAWERLISRHTRLLLSVARSFGGGHDEAMDRYTSMLEKLQEGDFRRLRAFRDDGRARFSTWLTVAARRICLDYHRARYGRTAPGEKSPTADPIRAIRRRLANAEFADLDADLIPDGGVTPADDRADRVELDRLLRMAIGRLLPRDRLLLSLRFEDGLSAARIGRILEFPTPFHVYRRLNVVLAGLRAELQARGVESADG